MKFTRQCIWVPLFGVALFFLGSASTSKSQSSGPAAPKVISTPPGPSSAQPPTNSAISVATTPPVYVPDMAHVGESLPDGIIAWDNLTKSTDADANQSQAQFTFNLTNVSSDSIAIVNVHPSCGCTTAQLPPMPWVLVPGTNGQIKLTVNLAGKSGTLFKTVAVATDKGSKTLTLRINILPPVVPTLSEADRLRGQEMAKADRQAIFKNDCATCHVTPGNGKYGMALYNAVCAVCHDAEHRATMVPDLRSLKVPTNEQFWHIWIAHGKPGSLMPAFSVTDGGPLNDLQIASLAAYLNIAMPSHVAAPN